MLCTIGPIAARGSELTSGLAVGFGSIVGDESESMERTSADVSGPAVFSLDFSSEGAASSGFLVSPESSELAAGGEAVCGVVSSA